MIAAHNRLKPLFKVMVELFVLHKTWDAPKKKKKNLDIELKGWFKIDPSLENNFVRHQAFEYKYH